MKELTFMPESLVRQLTKEEADKHYTDLILLRRFYKYQGNTKKSIEVLNWPQSKVKNYAYVLKGE